VVGNLESRPSESPPLSAAPLTEQFRSLDGLRAVSITLVLLDHLGIPWRGKRLDLGVGDYGHLGVVIFFVISGFLITSLLMTERSRKGRVSLTRFYARRALRIFPAAYCYIACVFALGLMGYVTIPTRDFAAAITYTENFLPDPIWLFGHLWSLSVEEQFYLMWPAAFASLALRRATGVAVAVMLLGPLARAAAWILFRETPYGDVPMFPMVADSLAAGCLLAIWRNWLEGRKWYMRLLQPVPSLILVALVLILNRLTGYGMVEVFGRSVENIAIAILIHRSIHHSWDAAGRFLNAGLPSFVGQLSYSLYLWQQLFLDRHSSSWHNLFPQNLVLTLLTALASYYLLEKPVMALRHRLRA
jgi:peptidoglycan/LPS O-acetylase OafA/YrhL